MNQVLGATLEDDGDKEMCYAAKLRAKKDLEKFQRKRPRKWLWTFLAVVVGLGVGFGGAKGIAVLFGGLYSRAGMDRISNLYAEKYHMKDLAVDEALIVALDYNSMEPRFYSKYFDAASPGIYNQTAAQAIASSASPPIVFTPNMLVTKLGHMVQAMIDGGMIANNPAIYAYQTAMYLNKRAKSKDIKMLSIAAGTVPFKGITSPNQFTKLKDKLYKGLNNDGTDIRMHNGFMQYFAFPKEEQWLRLESVSRTSLMGVDKKSIADLEANGHKLFKDKRTVIMKWVREMVDEKFGPAQSTS